MKNSGNEVNWYEGPLPEGSRRSLFRWGDPRVYKHPNQGMVRLLCERLGMKMEDFESPLDLGLEPLGEEKRVDLDMPCMQHLREIAGPENVDYSTVRRVEASYGKGMIDALRLRAGIVENLPDAVVYPGSTEEVEALVRYCSEQRMPCYTRGGGSSVTRGTEAVRGGITLDLARRTNKVVSFNETDQTITVQAGMMGPELERILNHAPEELGAKRRYTCGHFPQSFEFSSVGGWVVTRGAGQNSTYYGKIEDIVISQVMVTPRGTVRTFGVPRCAAGPDFDQILMGSEGAFGVLTEVTLKVCRYEPENRRRFSFLFKNWQSAMDACREIMQSEGGLPSVFRLSDPEETEVGMHLYGLAGNPALGVLEKLGYRPMERCLLLGSADGSGEYARLAERTVRKACRKVGALELSLLGLTKRWEHSRFLDPYMREDLSDFGVLIDTLECAVTWSQMKEVHSQVREMIKSRPNTICMTHLSHAYPQGGNLYFIFIARINELDEYLRLQYGVLDAIERSGAIMSHHHGIGKQTGPWFVRQAGEELMGVVRALKEHFDPQGVMNPGGTLGMEK